MPKYLKLVPFGPVLWCDPVRDADAARSVDVVPSAAPDRGKARGIDDGARPDAIDLERGREGMGGERPSGCERGEK